MIERVFNNDKPMYYCTLCNRSFRALHEANEHGRFCGKAVPTQPVFKSYTTAATFEEDDDDTQFYTNERRTWQGLTNNELQPIADEYRILFGGWVEDFARAIEAALKKKNT